MPATDVSSVAYSINELGQVAGSITDANGRTLAVMWDGSSIVQLDELIHDDHRDFPDGLNSLVGDMRRREWNASTPRATADDARTIIDGIEPIIEVQFERLAIALRRISGVLPMERASDLLADRFAFQPVLMPRILTFGRLMNCPSQCIAVTVIERIGLSENDRVGVAVQFPVRRDCRTLEEASDKTFHYRPSVEATDKEPLGKE